MAKFLGEEYDPVDFDEVSDSKLAGMLETEDRDLVLTFAQRIIDEPEEHKYDKYDETRVNELPLPQGYSFSEAKRFVEDFQGAVTKAVDAYQNQVYRDGTVFRVMTDDWMTLAKVHKLANEDLINPYILTISRVEDILQELIEKDSIEAAYVLHISCGHPTTPDGKPSGGFEIYRKKMS